MSCLACTMNVNIVELLTRIELVTSSLPRKCSTTELQQQGVCLGSFGAEDGAQTRDPQLGRLVLYQLSYFRRSLCAICPRGAAGIRRSLVRAFAAALRIEDYPKAAAKVHIIFESQKLFPFFLSILTFFFVFLQLP